jgi:hypothetical protein
MTAGKMHSALTETGLRLADLQDADVRAVKLQAVWLD